MSQSLLSTSQWPRWWWWILVAIGAVIAFGLPETQGDLRLLFQVDTMILFVVAILALSMGFLWGFVGILSLGQTAFFGLGGYTFAVWLMSTETFALGLVFATVVGGITALILGYFMFYGRITEIYLSVITLVTTLVLEKAIRATSGDQYTLFDIRLNGQNGIQIPFQLSLESFDLRYYLCAGALILVYVLLRLLLASKFGRVLVGIRENERRVELLGYDARRYKLFAFALCGAIAGLAGALFAMQGDRVGPEMMNLEQAALIIIYVLVGGRLTLLGPVVGAIGIYSLNVWLSTQGVGQVTLVMGAILIVFVLLVRNGVVGTLAQAGDWLLGKIRRSPPANKAASPQAEPGG